MFRPLTMRMPVVSTPAALRRVSYGTVTGDASSRMPYGRVSSKRNLGFVTMSNQQQVRWATTTSSISSSTLPAGAQDDPEEGLTSFGGGGNNTEDSTLSTEVNEDDEDADAVSDFDVEAAAAQEIHDLVVAIHQYVVNLYAGDYTLKTEKQSADLFDEMVTKLLGMMTRSVVLKVIESANKQSQEWLTNDEGDQAFRHLVEKTKWDDETSPFPKMFTHSPHELMNTRADIPQQQIEFALSYRDQHTLKLLEELCDGPKSPANTYQGVLHNTGRTCLDRTMPTTTRLATALHLKLEECTAGLQPVISHTHGKNTKFFGYAPDRTSFD